MDEKLKYKIKSTVDKLGILQCREMFGDDIIKEVYIDNPESYLDHFKNLRKIDNLFIEYIDNHDDEYAVFYYRTKGQKVFFNNSLIWDFFYMLMDYNTPQVEKTLRNWLKENYNIIGFKPNPFG